MRSMILLFVITLTAAPVVSDDIVITDDQCLASAIYYEASGEPLEGKVAVMEVIQNRAKARDLSICFVVLQKRQFSWFPRRRIRNLDDDMLKLLTDVNNSPRILNDERYLYFHNRHVKPAWATEMHCRRIGRHMFCRERAYP